MSQPATQLIALIVGIDRWISDEVRDLYGCVADAHLVSQTFRDQFHCPGESIRLVLNEEATREGIERAFRDQLIAKAKDMSLEERAETAFVFHYSGHGSRAVRNESDTATGFDETLVPHDSRSPNVYDIRDWELGSWIDELTDLATNVTIVLDCCHSGSGTRDDDMNSRECPADMRPQPPRTTTRSSKVQDASERYTLLASCRADEIAREIYPKDTGASETYGAMTWFMTQEIGNLPTRPLTYRELHERVRHRVNNRFPKQVPQCEGAIDRVLFGGMVPSSRSIRSVVDIKDGYYWIDLGQSHGITEGSTLKVYPPSTQSSPDPSEAIAELTVEDVGAIRSACSITVGETVPLHAKVVVSDIAQSRSPHRLALYVGEGVAREILNASALKPLVARDDDNPEIVITETDEGYCVEDAYGRIVPTNYSADSVRQLVEDLAARVRFQNALEIRNTAPDSDLAGAVRMVVKQLDFDAGTQQPIAVPLERTPGGETVFSVGERLVIEITNHSSQPLYVYLFIFAHDGSVARLYPQARGMQQKLTPGRTVSIGLSAKKSEQLWVQEQEQAETLERLKVFATIEETSFEAIEQGAITSTRSIGGSALDQMLALAAGGHRGLGAPPSTAADEWTTAELDFRVVRSTDDTAYPLAADRSTKVAEYGLNVSVPEGFIGQLKVMTARQEMRSVMAKGATPRQPAVAPRFGDLLEPFILGGLSRSSVDATVLELACDDTSRELVSESNPVSIELATSSADDAGTLVLAEQDGLFFPVGRSIDSPSKLQIDWLPPATIEASTSTDTSGTSGSEETRGVLRTLRLYLYKLAKIPPTDLGLRRVRYVPNGESIGALDDGEININTPEGRILSRPFQKTDLIAGQRLLLLVHGFQSDTRWMVEGPAQWLAEAEVAYDQVLTFDYESFNTSVGDNARAFAEALKEAGFSANDGVQLDIIAHSMGGVVTRAMIELNDGGDFVDNCIFAGSPHCGTLLAEGIRFVPWIGTLLANLGGAVPATVFAAWILKKLSDDAIGPRDLRPTAEIIKQINASRSNVDVKYHLLAGDNSEQVASKPGWRAIAARLSRATDTVLDQFFGDAHDMVVNTQSASTIRDGKYPNELLSTALTSCNHFGYFDQAESREQIITWLK